MSWSRERLEKVARTRLHGARLVVVANREPYVHVREGDVVRCVRPAGGLATALDPVMRACGGVWVGHGAGNADRAFTDARGRVAVPPEAPAYTLRRVWLNEIEERGYYDGAANDALWPLLHAAYTRPRFDPNDWLQYRRVNQKFADAVLDEIEDEPAIVFVQDYHFALLPRMLKDARPDLVVCQFWHVPWPHRETFRICPWHDEILDGLLGNDLLAFHAQDHCNNFLDTIDRGVEARVDPEHSTIVHGGKPTLVRPHPISVDTHALDAIDPERLRDERRRLVQRFRLQGKKLVVGVDRLDYTKGIPERLFAVDRLLTVHPELAGRFHLLQVAAPSRVHVPAYRRLAEEVDGLVAEINRKHGRDDWQPVLHLQEHFDQTRVHAAYLLADACVVSSLHDGMNLVAKEFVAARRDLRGALVLSKFTGAARELARGALLVNPYAVDEFAEAIHDAITMPAIEQERRMRRLRAAVDENDIYRWAGRLLSEAGKLVEVQDHDRRPLARPARLGRRLSNGHALGAVL